MLLPPFPLSLPYLYSLSPFLLYSLVVQPTIIHLPISQQWYIWIPLALIGIHLLLFMHSGYFTPKEKATFTLHILYTFQMWHIVTYFAILKF